MMGRQDQPQNNLFHYCVNLDQRIRSNHPLRKINELIDFDFAYAAEKQRGQALKRENWKAKEV